MCYRSLRPRRRRPRAKVPIGPWTDYAPSGASEKPPALAGGLFMAYYRHLFAPDRRLLKASETAFASAGVHPRARVSDRQRHSACLINVRMCFDLSAVPLCIARLEEKVMTSSFALSSPFARRISYHAPASQETKDSEQPFNCWRQEVPVICHEQAAR